MSGGGVASDAWLKSADGKWPIIAVWVILAVMLAVGLWGFKAEARSINFLIVAAIGFAVGTTEMMARYPDAPFEPMLSWPGLFYFGLNAGAAMLAYFLVYTLDPPISADAAEMGAQKKAIWQVLLAGFGAMAFFRSGFFTVPINGEDQTIGPNLVLQIVLRSLDRAYDRQRSAPRSSEVGKIMGGISFEAARTALPMICFSLMQNITPEERSAFGRQVLAIAESTETNDDAKALTLGLELMNLVGEGTLRCAINVLGPAIHGFQVMEFSRVLKLAAIQSNNAVINLPVVCNEIAHSSLRTDPKALIGGITALEISDESKALLILYRLINRYGPATVDAAMNALAPMSTTKPLEVPPEPAAPPGPKP